MVGFWKELVGWGRDVVVAEIHVYGGVAGRALPMEVGCGGFVDGVAVEGHVDGSA